VHRSKEVREVRKGGAGSEIFAGGGVEGKKVSAWDSGSTSKLDFRCYAVRGRRKLVEERAKNISGLENSGGKPGSLKMKSTGKWARGGAGLPMW